MTKNMKIAAVAVCAMVFCSSPAFSQKSGLSGFSDAFLRDYNSAQAMVDQSKSAEPLIALLRVYTNATEQAELEVSIGLLFNQVAGIVNPSNAVVHFTAALKYDLPDKTYISILLWRGSSHGQLNKLNEALTDYLRGLLACTLYDLSGKWPEIRRPNFPVYGHSIEYPGYDPRFPDYSRYRKQVQLRQFLIRERYYFIDSAKRILQEQPKSDRQIIEILQTLSPDSSNFQTVLDWLKSENLRPWP